MSKVVIRKGEKMTSKEYCKVAIKALDDRKAEDIRIIDISEVSPVADYFIIASGNNQNQIQAMRDAVDEALSKAGLAVKQIEGNSSSTWILMDYSDIVIHIFSKEDRLFYDLERIWRDGKMMTPDDF
jgi:ribosome-associated protein